MRLPGHLLMAGADQEKTPVDFACFMLWGGVKSKEIILEDFRTHFEIVGQYEVWWSKKFYSENIDRLYERKYSPTKFHGWDEKIGEPPFLFVAVKDLAPDYGYVRNTSGVLSLCNKNVISAKRRARASLSSSFQVHSSDNFDHFLSQTALVLGPKPLLALLAGEKDTSQKSIHRDLTGAGGKWGNFSEVIEILNVASNYVVLRNFESLLSKGADGDVDFLTDNYQRLASLLGLRQSPIRPYRGHIEVAGHRTAVDIRFIGDKYLPAVWQREILRQRVASHGVFVPSPEDLFFSILYHCKVQKHEIKRKYREDLPALARDLQFDWFRPEDLDNDVSMAKILSGFMLGAGYYYEAPVDSQVRRNTNWKVARGLPRPVSNVVVSSNIVRAALLNPGLAIRVLMSIFFPKISAARVQESASAP